MPKTKTYGDLLSSIAKKISRTTEEDFSALILNSTIEEIWKRYEWRESIETLPPFWLSPKTQDYGSPLKIIPDNFDGLRTAFVVQVAGENPRITPIRVSKNLDRTSIQGPLQALAYNFDTQSFRVFPNTPASYGTPEWMIIGTYKKLPPTIQYTDFQGTVLPFDDKWFNQIRQVALWKGYELNGSPQEQEQSFKALAAIDEMARDQGLNDGDTTITPSGVFAFTSINLYPGPLWR